MKSLFVAKLTVAILVLTATATSALEPGGTFVDDDGTTMEPAIEAIASQGITQGCDAERSLYCPFAPVSRGEVAVFLVRALGRDGSLAAYRGIYPDVPSSAWFAPHIELLSELGIMAGYADGTFRPARPVTRAETAALLVRALGKERLAATRRFVDVPPDAWFAGFVESLAAMGVTSGCSTAPSLYCPSGLVTRGEMALFLQKAFDLQIEPVPPRTAPAAATGEVVWVGHQESDWYSDAISGKADISSVVHPVLGPAVKASNFDVDGSHNAGARIGFQGFDDPSGADPVPHAGDRIMPTEAWYSAQFFVPFFIDGQDNVFQFKQGDGSTRRHLWNVGWKPVDGELRFIIRTRLEGATWTSTPRRVAVLGPVPIGTPFTIEVFRRMSTGPDGRYQVRIDGEVVYEFEGPTIANNLEPRPAGNHTWVLSHYLGDWQGAVDPADSWIFFTNATIRR